MKLNKKSQKMIKFYFMIIILNFFTFNSKSVFSHENVCGDFLSKESNVRYVQFGRARTQTHQSLIKPIEPEVVSLKPHKNVKPIAVESKITIQETPFFYSLVPTLNNVLLYLANDNDQYKNLYTSFHEYYVVYIETLDYWEINHPEVYEETIELFILVHRIYVSKEFDELLMKRGAVKIPLTEEKKSMLSQHLSGRTFSDDLDGQTLRNYIKEKIQYLSTFY